MDKDKIRRYREEENRRQQETTKRMDRLRPIFEKFYDPSTTLQEDIDTLRNPEIEVDNMLVLNVVAKFFWAYNTGVDPETSCTQTITLENVLRAFAPKSILPSEAQLFKPLRIALRKLHDLRTAATIFRDLISQQLPAGTLPDRESLGLDLAAGTGIHLLAQDILAHRHKIRELIDLVGVEENGGLAEHSSEILECLGVGKVIHADPSDVDAYEAMEADKPLWYVSCDAFTTVDNYPNRSGYIPIMRRIREMFSAFQCLHTHFFPADITVITEERSDSGTPNFWEHLKRIADTIVLRKNDIDRPIEETDVLFLYANFIKIVADGEWKRRDRIGQGVVEKTLNDIFPTDEKEYDELFSRRCKLAF